MIEDYLPTRAGYDRKKPVPLAEQHGVCPSWWGLKNDDETTACCAICLRSLGPVAEVEGQRIGAGGGNNG